MQRLRLMWRLAEDEAGTDTMAEVDDGTAPATEEDAAATPEAGAAEDDAGADTMAEVEDGTAPATEEDAAATPEAEASEDDAGADTMAEVDDGTAPATEEDAAASADVEASETRPAPTLWRRSKTAPRPLPRKMQRLRLMWR